MKNTLAINFLNKKATVEQTEELMSAISHEEYEMTIQLVQTDITRIEKQLANLKDNEDKTPEQKEVEEKLSQSNSKRLRLILKLHGITLLIH